MLCANLAIQRPLTKPVMYLGAICQQKSSPSFRGIMVTKNPPAFRGIMRFCYVIFNSHMFNAPRFNSEKDVSLQNFVL
jgi:hypothetical protein